MSSLKESSKKRHCSGTDTDSYNTLQDNTAELQLMLHTLKDDIVSEVTGIFNKAKISATASAEKSHSEVYDVVESVHKSENIEELKTILQSCDFLVDIDKRAAFCGICVENPNAIALGGSEKKAGIFQFDIDVPNTLNEMCPAQLRLFLNLKKSIVRHLCNSETHQKLKEKKDKELKEKSARATRNYEIGLNLFRLRYI